MKINIEPTPEGYEGIAKMFVQDVLGRLDVADAEDSRVLLENVVSISVYLAVNHPHLYEKFDKWLKEK
ncbi:hypothetical protein LCGC14_1203730 [marine sediment metagenome]|uniref:Uncharacterized protein n=1 Tax=marine sediment metagenome TaxID=412755 RepID=A0A0F9LG64_9ZZZZ